MGEVPLYSRVGPETVLLCVSILPLLDCVMSLRSSWSGDTTPCRMTGMILHSACDPEATPASNPKGCPRGASHPPTIGGGKAPLGGAGVGSGESDLPENSGGTGRSVSCRVQGSGFRVQGPEFRVQGSGFRVQGLGFRVQGSGFRAQGLPRQLTVRRRV